MNLQDRIRIFGFLFAIVSTARITSGAVVPDSEPHGATSRIPDRSLGSSSGSRSPNIVQLTNAAYGAVSQGNDEVAIARSTEALALHPDKRVAAFLYFIRSQAFYDRNRSQAMIEAESAIRVDPTTPYGYIARGFLNSQSGKDDSAIRDFNEAIKYNSNRRITYAEDQLSRHSLGHNAHTFNNPIRFDPQGPGEDPYIYRSIAYSHKHDFGAALADLGVSLSHAQSEYESYHGYVLNQIAWIRAASPDPKFRDGKKAVELSTKACALLKWKDPNFLDTLAAAYAECGNFDQAIKYGNQAVSLKQLLKGSSQDKDSATARIQEHLRLFQNHKAVRADFKSF